MFSNMSQILTKELEQEKKRNQIEITNRIEKLENLSNLRNYEAPPYFPPSYYANYGTCIC